MLLCNLACRLDFLPHCINAFLSLLNLALRIPAASVIVTGLLQLSLIRSYTSVCSNYHFLNLKILLVESYCSPDVMQMGIWSEVGCQIVDTLARLKCAFQSCETNILSSFTREGSSHILDHVYFLFITGISSTPKSLIESHPFPIIPAPLSVMCKAHHIEVTSQYPWILCTIGHASKFSKKFLP